MEPTLDIEELLTLLKDPALALTGVQTVGYIAVNERDAIAGPCPNREPHSPLHATTRSLAGRISEARRCVAQGKAKLCREPIPQI
jgi:hypothetical protein